MQRRNAAEARSNALDKEWNENEKRIAEINNLLKQRKATSASCSASRGK